MCSWGISTPFPRSCRRSPCNFLIRPKVNKPENVGTVGARVYIIQPDLRKGPVVGRHASDQLEEARGLAAAIALEIVGDRICAVSKLSPAHLIGKGQAEEIGQFVRE